MDAGNLSMPRVIRVSAIPCRNERGLYYAVDLGGTNFRVLRIQVGGREGRILKQEQKAVPIPRELMVGSSKVWSGKGGSL